jgi:hypothetical protein
MSYGTVQAERLTTESGFSLGAGNASSFKNRIINGGMDIDQRNAGASITPTDGLFSVDRWKNGLTAASKYSTQQSSIAPTGFSFSLLATSLSSYSVVSSDEFEIFQNIEGFNSADLGWGTANAKAITLSFWARSSLTGTFGGALSNATGNRAYPFTYTINSANTWEYETITIPGDTTGTWAGATNGTGIQVFFSYGAGSSKLGTPGAWAASNAKGATGQVNLVATSGATLAITGVQFEVGTVATSFDFRSIGTELALCQRYFETSYPAGATIPTALANGWSSTTLQNLVEGPSGVIFKVTKRANPTMVMYNAVNAAAGAMYRAGDAASITTGFDFIGVNQVGLVRPASANANSYYLHWTASIEL